MLFGNILGITFEEMLQFDILAFVILFIVYLRRKDLLLYCFDCGYAKSIGLNITLLHYSLLSLLALGIVGAMQIVGILLVVAMLITPSITVALLSKNFVRMQIIAVSVSLVSGVIGMLVSYHLDSAPSATIVLVQAFCFICAVFINKRARVVKLM